MLMWLLNWFAAELDAGFFSLPKALVVVQVHLHSVADLVSWTSFFSGLDSSLRYIDTP